MRAPAGLPLLVGALLGTAVLTTGCSSSSITTATTAGTPAPGSVPSRPTSSAVSAAPTNDDLLHPFDGTWQKQFTPVACAIAGGEPTTTAAPNVTTMWDLAPNCPVPRPSTTKPVFYWATSLTIDGSTITIDFPTNPSCVGAMHANGTTPGGETNVVIDHVTCGGHPAADVTTTLRLDGDVLYADGEGIPRKRAGGAGAAPSTTGYTTPGTPIS
jgi:hypothetical protein